MAEYKRKGKHMETAKDIIVNIRNIRADMNIPHSKKIKVSLAPLKRGAGPALSGVMEYIKNLAQLDELVVEDVGFKKPKSSLSAITENFNIFIPMEGVIDMEAEKARLAKKQDLLKQQLVFAERKLKDKNFMDHAPENVVMLEQEKAAKIKEQIDRMENTIKDL
jgi:valyl-tRNA synthetase